MGTVFATGSNQPKLIAYKTSAQAVSGSAIIVFNNIEIDSHGGFNTGTGRYTVQVAGLYHVSFSVLFETQAYGAGNLLSAAIRTTKIAVLGRDVYIEQADAAINRVPRVSGHTMLECDFGDILDVAVFETRAAGDANVNNNYIPAPGQISIPLNWLAISRIG